MRNLNQMLKAFVTVGATTALLGCKEIDPPKPVTPTVVRASVNENVKVDASENVNESANVNVNESANVNANVNESANVNEDVNAKEDDSVEGILSATRKAL